MHIFWGFILALVGFLLVWQTEWLVTNFGHITWAEEHLGSDGGTRIFYKLLGILVIVVGFCIVTGLFQAILTATVLPLFSGLKGV